MFDLYAINKEYIKYLKEYDDFLDYKDISFDIVCGSVFTNNDNEFYAPVEKRIYARTNLCFSINVIISNMFPADKSVLTKIKDPGLDILFKCKGQIETRARHAYYKACKENSNSYSISYQLLESVYRNFHS